jgi:hypothetical protein
VKASQEVSVAPFASRRSATCATIVHAQPVARCNTGTCLMHADSERAQNTWAWSQTCHTRTRTTTMSRSNSCLALNFQVFSPLLNNLCMYVCMFATSAIGRIVLVAVVPCTASSCAARNWLRPLLIQAMRGTRAGTNPRMMSLRLMWHHNPRGAVQTASRGVILRARITAQQAGTSTFRSTAAAAICMARCR